MLGSNAGLMPAERQALHALLVRPYQDLDQVETAIRAVFPAWFVYRGGSHVALHVRAYQPGVESDRLAIWTEERLPVDYGEHETLGVELAIQNAYGRGRRLAEKKFGELGALERAQAIAARYEHRATESAYLEGFNDRTDELREAALEDAAELGEG